MSATNSRTARNARFWFWHNGWVKIALQPGQIVTAHSGGPHDEGYSFTSETFEHTGESVRSEVYEEGRDCDGRHSWHCECECPLDLLAANCAERDDAPENVGIYTPAWERVGAGQRDYAAEAMGY